MYTDMNINILFLFVKVSVEEEGVIEVMMTLEVSEVNFTCRVCEYFSNFMHCYRQFCTSCLCIWFRWCWWRW